MGNIECQSEKECPTCKANNIKSSTTRNPCYRQTLVMPVTYYDTATNSWITSNPNNTTYSYMCQYGHRFEIAE